MKKFRKLIVLTLFLTLLIPYWMKKIYECVEIQELNTDIIQSQEYREMNLNEKFIDYLQTSEEKGRDAALALLETDFGYQSMRNSYKNSTFQQLEAKWKKNETWYDLLSYSEAIWEEIKYFPIPESTADDKLKVSYTNSWMTERTYGGKRGHEGTDLMASENVPGLFPIVSITDGTITSIGWLEKGGYRIGVTNESGAYFYYAHLDSYANIKAGDVVKAGDLLGFMGDTGYGTEGTTGMFPVHLHLGIYLYQDNKEISVNPYWILRYLEEHKVKCAYSSGDMK